MLCPVGHRADPITGECKDIDECAQNIHECGPYQKCQNIAGGYYCYCPQGIFYFSIDLSMKKKIN